MPSISSYVGLVKLLLAESAKYFALLLIVVLAIRLWRRLPKLASGKRAGNVSLACLVSTLAIGIGYFSICHSMSLMYSYYGMQAFHANRLEPAFLLFQTSLTYHNNADALGGKGVCLLWSGRAEDGLRALEEARALRKGKGSPFEDFYEGLYLFYHGDTTHAVPLLDAASVSPDFLWNVTKLIAVIQLDANNPQEAARLMQPYIQADVTEPDQAYVIASIRLSDGKKAEAMALMNQFMTNGLTPFWLARFEKLQSKIQKQQP
jgi:tetratricopeptide (TPR) repeat protein